MAEVVNIDMMDLWMINIFSSFDVLLIRIKSFVGKQAIFSRSELLHN